MDEGESGGGYGNEAISAVAGDGFMMDEDEDDDYDDLYNDVNVGEGFLQSFKKTDDVAVETSVGRSQQQQENQFSAPLPSPPPLPAQVVNSVTNGGGGMRVELGGKVGRSESVKEEQNGFGCNAHGEGLGKPLIQPQLSGGGGQGFYRRHISSSSLVVVKEGI